MGAAWRSVRLLEAAPEDDIQTVSEILGEVRDAYTVTDVTMSAGDQVNTLYAREYAAERGYHGIGEQAETLLETKNERRLQQRLVQVPSGVAGLAVADLTYADTVMDEMTAFVAEYGPAYMAEASASLPDVVAGVPLAAATGYAAGEAFYRRCADGGDGIPLDVDHRHWFYPPVAAVREELLEAYDIDTYCRNPVVPKRYD